MQILILANHSGGLYDFRKDLIAALKQHAEVSVAVPRNDRWDELQALADRVIELPIDRRGMNPARDAKLLGQYRAILKQLRPDLVLTYTIKPNIYGGLACRELHIPYAVNITGLGSAIENGGWLKRFVLTLYKPVLAGAKVVFFENAGNRDTLAATGVVPRGRDVVLHGAGVNLEDYPCQPYPQEGTVRFLFVGRVMHEKGVDELFAAAKRMKQTYGDGVEFHIVGSFEEGYKPLMGELEHFWRGQVPRLSVGHEALLRHGGLRCAALLPRGDVQRAAGGCRLRPSAHHERYPRLPRGGRARCERVSVPCARCGRALCRDAAVSRAAPRAAGGDGRGVARLDRAQF